MGADELVGTADDGHVREVEFFLNGKLQSS